MSLKFFSSPPAYLKHHLKSPWSLLWPFPIGVTYPSFESLLWGFVPPLWGLSHFTVICMPAFSFLLNYTLLRPGTRSCSCWVPPWPQHTCCLLNAWQARVQSESCSLSHSCFSPLHVGMAEPRSNEEPLEPILFSWAMCIFILAFVISVICKDYFHWCFINLAVHYVTNTMIPLMLFWVDYFYLVLNHKSHK